MQTYAFHHHRLRIWHTARELARLVHVAPLGDAELRDQSSRAARSVALNIAEGAAHDGRARTQFFRRARASVIEIVAAYELAEDIGEHPPTKDIYAIASPLAAGLTALITRS